MYLKKFDFDEEATATARARPHLAIDALILATTFFFLSEPTFMLANHGIRVLLPVCLAISFLFFTRHRRTEPGRSNSLTIPLFLFAVLVALSVLWTDDFEATAIASVIVVLSLVFGMLSGSGRNVNFYIAVLIIFPALALLASLALWLIDPQTATVSAQYEHGSFRGVYTHRNQFAYMMVIGLVASVSRLLFIRDRRLLSILCILVFTGAALEAQSATALATAAASTAIALGIWLSMSSPKRLRLATLVLTTVVSLLVSAWLFTNSSVLLTGLDRDATLTGRTAIWAAALQVSENHRWLGVGWGDAWLDTSAVQHEIAAIIGFRAYHAHNSFLDILLQVGAVGLTLIALAIVSLVVQSLRKLLISVHLSQEAAVALVFVFALTTYSMVEARLSLPLGLTILAFLGGAVGVRRRPDKNA